MRAPVAQLDEHTDDVATAGEPDRVERVAGPVRAIAPARAVSLVVAVLDLGGVDCERTVDLRGPGRPGVVKPGAIERTGYTIAYDY